MMIRKPLNETKVRVPRRRANLMRSLIILLAAIPLRRSAAFFENAKSTGFVVGPN
jgi:hypothetical protein